MSCAGAELARQTKSGTNKHITRLQSAGWCIVLSLTMKKLVLNILLRSGQSIADNFLSLADDVVEMSLALEALRIDL